MPAFLFVCLFVFVLFVSFNIHGATFETYLLVTEWVVFVNRNWSCAQKSVVMLERNVDEWVYLTAKRKYFDSSLQLACAWGSIFVARMARLVKLRAGDFVQSNVCPL